MIFIEVIITKALLQELARSDSTFGNISQNSDIANEYKLPLKKLSSRSFF